MEIKALMEAADGGNIEAQYDLGKYYYLEYHKLMGRYASYNSYNISNPKHFKGKEPPFPDFDRAILWYKRAAENGFLKAQMALGELYKNGMYMELTYEEYITDFETVGIMAKDIIQSETHVVACVEQDYKQAIYWYTKSAEQGDIGPQFLLGRYYEEGELVTQDYKQAVYWYTKSAEQGNTNAQYELGVCYSEGKGVEQNYEQAVYWYTKSAKSGNTNSQYKLGLCYSEGEGVEQDYGQALCWYRQAAEQYHVEAYKMLPDDIKHEVDGILGDTLPF